MTESAVIPVKEGDLLAGKYRVERILGVGGMGIVVSALHEQLEQRVAIKFVREEALGNEEAVQRFLREARAAVKLRSEHAAKVLDVGTLDSGAPYMVMEFLEGSDLAAVLGEHGPLQFEVAAAYIVQACEAVAEAHAAGIVHRDLKPQNLFLARTVGGASRVKVLDFGVSKSMTQGSGGLTQTRSMLGSPLYMSPEQMRSSRDVDSRSDVWALGVVLYELLTQRWPFEAETMPELCLKVVTEPPHSLLELRPDAPPAMVEVIERCLAKDPAARYSDAAELASALEPLAPPESRVTIERARLAMGATGRRPLRSSAGLTPLPGSSATAPAATAGARTAPTPAAWGSGKGESPAAAASGEGKRGGGAMWIGLGIAAAAVVGGVVFLLSGRGAPAEPATATPVVPPSAVLAPAPPATAPSTTLASGAATALAAASAGENATAEVAPAPSASSMPASTVAGTPRPWLPVGAAPSTGVKPLTPPMRRAGASGASGASGANGANGKPGHKPGDDDIPSLR